MPINWKTAVATGLEKVSFHSKPMEGQCQRIECTQLHSFHIPARLCSKSFKLGFSSTWTKNMQVNNLGLEKAEESEIKLPTFVGSWRKQESSRKNLCFIDYTKAFDCVDHNKLWKILKETGVPDHLTVSWETWKWVKKQKLEHYMEQLAGSKLGKEYDTTLYCHPPYLLICGVHHVKCWAGWCTS